MVYEFVNYYHPKKSKITYKSMIQHVSPNKRLAQFFTRNDQSMFIDNDYIFFTDENEFMLQEQMGTMIWRGLDIKPAIIQNIVNC